MIIAHLTDPHLPLGLPSCAELAPKRLLSLISWQRRRRYLHRAEIAARAIDDVVSAKPDFIAITGDLVNFSLPREFAAGAEWLSRLGSPKCTGVVPGNHEALVAGFESPMRTHWGAYLESDDGTPGFPWLRRRGEVAFIGVSSAVVTPPLFASGRVGETQCARLAQLLAETGREGLFRVVLIHHPPTGIVNRRKGLSDRQRVTEVLAGEGAELVLHGHTHRADLSWIDAVHTRVPVIGAPSASMDPAHASWAEGGADGSAWFRIRVHRSGGQWSVGLCERRVTREGTVTDGVRLTFRLPALPAVSGGHDPEVP